MSNFSMISRQGDGFAGPQGFASDLLGFANRWQTAANAGRTNAMDLQQDIYNANQNQMNLNNQGTNEMIGDLTRSNQLFTGMSSNLDAQRELFMTQCAANGNDPQQCRATFDASVGRAPQQTQTQGPQMSYAPDVGLNINSILGLR
jgi:hypothetical protein